MKTVITATILSAAMLSQASFARDMDGMTNYEVTITNGTSHQVMTPPIVVAHDYDFKLFTLGAPASEGLAFLAENGDPTMLVNELAMNNDVSSTATGSGVVKPGESMTIQIQAPRHAMFSVAAMLASSNDAFMAVSSVEAPHRYTEEMAYVYDAGSEMNNEDCAYVPGPPCSMASGNARATVGSEGFVSFHTGIHNLKDLHANHLDWRGPVANITIRKMN